MCFIVGGFEVAFKYQLTASEKRLISPQIKLLNEALKNGKQIESFHAQLKIF